MNRRMLVWLVGGATVAFLIFAFSPYAPWAPEGGGPQDPGDQPPRPSVAALLGRMNKGRFKVIEAKENKLFILDTQTGDLYDAPPEVYQEYEKRVKQEEEE